MSRFEWNEEMNLICGQCIFKDENPGICNCVIPPIKKKFVPQNVSSCYFVRTSQFERMPQDKQEEIMEERKKRSERYYKK